MNEIKRDIVIPGEIIVSGKEYLPGDWTKKEGDKIIALRYGLADINNNLVRVIPLSGIYMPRVGNTIIGKIIDITVYGWNVDIRAPYLGFLLAPQKSKTKTIDLSEIYDINDLVICKVIDVKRKVVTLTTKGKGFGKIEEGFIISINPNKVPRVIGKEGSMINLIKKETNCNIIVGQNGIIWIKGEKEEDEIKAKEAIIYIAEKSYIDGLTEKIKEFLEKRK